MKKPILAFLALALVATSTTGCKRLLRGKGGDTDGDDPGSTKTTSGKSDDEKVTAKPTAGCKLESPVTSEVTLKKGCSIQIKDLIVVEGGGILKIEAGAKLAFSTGAGLQIRDAKLVVAGTEKEPVVFTSANRTPAAGDWAGILLDEGIMAGTELQFARIEYAGEDLHGSRGALSINGQKSPKRIALSNVTFQNNDRAAISADSEKSAFARFERNVFKANKIAVSAPAPVLASIGAGSTFGDPLETWGEVTESASWTAFGAPIQVKEHLAVSNGGSAPTLTLAPGTVLKFAGGTYFSVGEKNGGGLIAPKCTFTSLNATPHAGDWVGILFNKRATNVNLEGASLEYAGQDSNGGRGAITFPESNAKEARGFKLTGLTVKSAQHAAMGSPDGDCGDLGKQISVQGVPACRKD